jgi:D-alanyl-D-alanine carboxypeptidase
LPVGGEMTVDLALQALIIKSANDVAVMLAEAISGSEPAFVAQMNVTAKRLGMTRTTFMNTNGLPAPEQVTTARDLAKLARAIIAEFPEYAHNWAAPNMRLGKNRLTTHNGLLQSFEGADGMKTGFTCDSGFNIVASATRDGRQLVAVVLGDASSGERNVRAASLLEFGFQQQGWKRCSTRPRSTTCRCRYRSRREERAQRCLLVGLQGTQGARRQGGCCAQAHGQGPGEEAGSRGREAEGRAGERRRRPGRATQGLLPRAAIARKPYP